MTWSSHFSTLAFAFPLLACQRSNRVPSKTDDKEMSDVVKVRDLGNLPMFVCLVGYKTACIPCSFSKLKVVDFQTTPRGFIS